MLTAWVRMTVLTSLPFIVSILSSPAALAHPPTEPLEYDLTSKPPIDVAERMIESLIANSKIDSKKIYCVKNELTCRTHYSLIDLSGNPLDAFYLRFVAVDRSVGGNGYFFPVKNRPGVYIRFEDYTFDGKYNVDSIEDGNPVTVEKYPDGTLKAILGIRTLRLGTTKSTLADIRVDQHSTILEGITTDSADPSFSQKTRTEYLHTTVTN